MRCVFTGTGDQAAFSSPMPLSAPPSTLRAVSDWGEGVDVWQEEEEEEEEGGGMEDAMPLKELSSSGKLKYK